MAQPLDTLVEDAVVSCVLGFSLAEAVARVVGHREARCRDALLQDIDNGLMRKCRGLEPKEVERLGGRGSCSQGQAHTKLSV